MVDATAHRDPAVVRQVRNSHHHLVCRGCGRTEDVGCVVGEWPRLLAWTSRRAQNRHKASISRQR